MNKKREELYPEIANAYRLRRKQVWWATFTAAVPLSFSLGHRYYGNNESALFLLILGIFYVMVGVWGWIRVTEHIEHAERLIDKKRERNERAQ